MCALPNPPPPPLRRLTIQVARTALASSLSDSVVPLSLAPASSWDDAPLEVLFSLGTPPAGADPTWAIRCARGNLMCSIAAGAPAQPS
eukprot:975902-Prorocentrum_minimum.AAC.2